MRKLILLGAAVMITGCTSINGQFDCPLKGGVSCKSLKEIDGMVSRGEINSQEDDAKTSNAKASKSRTDLINEGFLHKMAPNRVGEQVMKVWVAPYVDASDNYHPASVFYTVIDRNHWSGNPPIAPERS